MDTEKNISQNQFCIWCGDAIKVDSKFCTKCGKKQTDEENPFIDWLIAHTKDKLKGDAESSLFDAIKNFILSHLYGTVMSIAIIAAAGITVYASEPYIQKYNDSNMPEYMSALYGNAEKAPVSQHNTVSVNSVRNVCNKYLDIVSVAGNNPADPVHGIVPTSGFKFSGEYEVIYNEKFVNTDSFYLRDSTSAVISKPTDFKLYITNQMFADGYNVAEYTKEQYIEDASSAEKIYTRQLIFSVVEIDGNWYVTESRIAGFSENEDYEWPIVIDENKLVSVMTDYINAVFTGGDLSSYEFHLPDEDQLNLYRDVLTLPDKCYGFIRVDNVQLGLYQRHSSMAASEALDKMGYETFTAEFRIKVEEQVEGRFMETNHSFVFAVINDNYYVVDDFIHSTSHSG